jgi:hypothetical protein
MQNTLVSPTSTSGRITAWVPPTVSSTLTARNVQQMLHGTLRKFFKGGKFDQTSGLELRFKVDRPAERAQIISGLKRHGIRVQ